MVAVVLIAFGTTAIAQNASIQFDGNEFKVVGWKAPPATPGGNWASVFAIYAGPGKIPPLLGTYSLQNDTLIFRPSFPISPGVQYRTVLKLPGGAPIEKTFDGPRRDVTPVAHVVQVYPSGDVLPSNQLRMYIYFSAPMSRSEATQYVHVLDETGKHLEGPRGIFLPGEELWDPTFDRLTLTLDPGRIKRGLTSNESIGPPIAEGKRYTLVIDRDWPDARGVPMADGFKKTFRGGPAVRIPPDPKQWRVTAPKAGTPDALVVDFPGPMNFPLLQRMIQVSGPNGPVIGSLSVVRNETEWRFTPREKWTAGNYRLIVDTGIEDLAGNHIGQPFDIDTFEKVTEHIAAKTVPVPFTIR